MLAAILTCTMMLCPSVQDTLNSFETEAVEVEAQTADPSKDQFWAKKRSLRIGYDMHTFQNESGSTFPVKFGVGLSRCRNVWLHKKPIAGMIKFAFDRGINLDYSMFNTKIDTEGYDGPSGYIGSDPVEPDEGEGDMPFDLSKMGMHYLSVGYALGASVTVNPVAKLRVNGYFHFVPSASFVLSGSMINLGFMPYCKYGAEVSYGWFGIGCEWSSGMSNMTDLLSKLTSENPDAEAVKAKYYSNYARIYMSFRFGKKKKK